MAEWEKFVFAGDEFLAAYASTTALGQATPYLIGHAIELYLKAIDIHPIKLGLIFILRQAIFGSSSSKTFAASSGIQGQEH